MGEVGETEYDIAMAGDRDRARGGPSSSNTTDADDYESLPHESVYVHMVAGAAAGMMEHTVMYPIDLMKTRLQSLCPCPEQACRTPVHGIISVAKREGLLTTWRGVNAIAVGAVPAHALYFSVYEKLKFSLTHGRVGHSQTWAYGLAGIAATVVHDAVMNPAEVIKQRMQMCASPYNGAVECAKCVLRAEGLRAFYRSYPTQLALNIPFQSTHFMVYEFATQAVNPSHAYDPKTHLFAGACAGGIAAALTTPFDVIKTVLNTQQGPLDVTHGPNTSQLGRTVSKLVQQNAAAAVASRTAHSSAAALPTGYCTVGYNGIADAFKGIYATRGVNGFFSGFQARVLTQIPATAISWSVYELFKYLLSLG